MSLWNSLRVTRRFFASIYQNVQENANTKNTNNESAQMKEVRLHHLQ